MIFTRKMFNKTVTNNIFEAEELAKTATREYKEFFKLEPDADIFDFLRFFFDIMLESSDYSESKIFEIESVILRNYRRA